MRLVVKLRQPRVKEEVVCALFRFSKSDASRESNTTSGHNARYPASYNNYFSELFEECLDV